MAHFFIDNHNEHRIEIKNIEKVAEIIRSLNDEMKCDCICIIRGGGSEDDMRLYSEPTLLDAMRDSKLPIITGIGHATDKPLCQNFARYSAIAPTDAAYFFLRVAANHEETRKLEASCPKMTGLKKLNPDIYEQQYHELERTPHKTLEQERKMAALRELVKKLRAN